MRIDVQSQPSTFRYYYIGNMVTDGESLERVVPGFDFSATGFKNTSLNGMFYEYMLALASGQLFETNTDNNINNYIKDMSIPRLDSNRVLLNMFASGRIQMSLRCTFGTIYSSATGRPVKFITDYSGGSKPIVSTVTPNNFSDSLWARYATILQWQ